MDCVEKKDIEKACLHWHKIIEITDKLGPPYNQDRAGIEALMREHRCAARGGGHNRRDGAKWQRPQAG